MVLFVNGEKIEDSVIKQEIECLRPRYERFFMEMEPEKREVQLRQWSKENVIEQVLFRQYAESNCEPIPEEEIEAALEKPGRENELVVRPAEKLKKEDIATGLSAGCLTAKTKRLIKQICSKVGAPSDKEILKYYDDNKQQFAEPEQLRISHIVKHPNWQTDESAAQAIMSEAKRELDGGAAFEVVAAKYSDCPDNGGDLGYIVRGRMVEEFEDVVFNLGAGQVSDVFRTRFGFHIARVYDRKAAVSADIEQVRSRIIEQLKEQKQQAAIDVFIDELKSKAEIKEV